MMHPAIHAAVSGIAGVGVVAMAHIPAGSVIWGPCPKCRVWTTQEQNRVPEAILLWIHEYGYSLNDGSVLVPCGGAHLMNHSCQSSVLDFGLNVGVAVQDMEPGDEVTCDYRTFAFDRPWQLHCNCGSTNCAGFIEIAGDGRYPNELRTMWKNRMREALDRMAVVSQFAKWQHGSVIDHRNVHRVASA
ncbi:SET domain-containing protein [Nocardia farcinica]|uniref:SET domain-containing protein n=1 Tax=Nocardia farcinica TaxID=37329 RepID=UPI002456DBEE|nr:SET domain-containing protein [Nocardia farcinica]